MNHSQRKIVAVAALLIAVILFVAYFLRPALAWALWNAREGTMDFGFVKFTNRPPFPADARGIGLGLVLPITLAAVGRVLGLSGKDEDAA